MSSSLYPVRTAINSISNIDSLASVLSLSVEVLLEVRELPLKKRYKDLEIPKSDGQTRKVCDPHPRVRLVQSRINSRIFCQLISWPDYLYGSLPNEVKNEQVIRRDYIACAQKHCGARSIFKTDISNYFDNIHKVFVNDIFSKLLKFPQEVSEYLTDICCRGDFLVQGALTSSYIATLCFWDMEGDIVKRFLRKGLVYTRLVDDITVSSKSSNYNFEYVEHHIKDMLIEKELPVNDSKKKIQRIGIDPLIVHGLRVNYQSPRLPADEVRRIRASVHNVVKMSKVNNYRTSLVYRKSHDRSMGRVNKLARVGHNKHEAYKNKLLQVLPLPSLLDIKKAKRAIYLLEKLDEEKIKEKRYRRKFYIAQYRVSIIKRTYAQEANFLKIRLAKISQRLGKKV